MTVGLTVAALRAGYGDVIAVRDLSLHVQPGEVVALVGRNGMGKTTALNAIAGILPAVGGTIEIDGHPLGALKAYARARLGLALVPEGKRVLRNFTVDKNLQLGGYAAETRVNLRERLDQIYRDLPILAERRSTTAGSLSGGQQQLLSIAQALVAGPRYLLLDEPTAGLSPAAISDVFGLVERIVADGVGVLLVEEQVDLTVDVGHRTIVMEQGRIVSETVHRSVAPVNGAAYASSQPHTK